MTASSRKLAALLGLTSGLLALAEGIAAQSFRCDDHLWRSGSSGRVVGGEAIALEDAPYQVVLAYRGRPFCGGTLIGPRHVLTAAHCVVDDGRPIPAGRLGVARTSHLSDAAFRSVAKVHVHPGYSSDGGSPNDIAVLALDYALTRSAQAIARIATPRLDRLFAQPGNCARTTGFGSMRVQGSTSRTLRAAAVPVLSVAECRGAYGQLVTKTQVCAGYPWGGRDSCQGDSGGPLIVREGPFAYLLVGVVSWGRGCAEPGAPGVYTRVAAHVDWIREVTGNGS